MPRLVIVLLLTLLAACTDSQEPRRAPVMTADALVLAADASLLQVEVRDVPPGARIDEILLLAPDGSATPARSRETSHSEGGPGYGPAGVGVSLSGGSSSGLSTGVSVGVNSYGGAGGDYATTTVLADLPVPDPALYRTDSDAWRIEVRWTDVAGQARVLPVRAPRP